MLQRCARSNRKQDVPRACQKCAGFCTPSAQRRVHQWAQWELILQHNVTPWKYVTLLQILNEHFCLLHSPTPECSLREILAGSIVIQLIHVIMKPKYSSVGSEVLTVVVMKSTIWDITPCGQLSHSMFQRNISPPSSRSKQSSACHLLSRWFLAWLIFPP
jgi:hypothetical protein